jgi:hypothetical protein
MTRTTQPCPAPVPRLDIDFIPNLLPDTILRSPARCNRRDLRHTHNTAAALSTPGESFSLDEARHSL